MSSELPTSSDDVPDATPTTADDLPPVEPPSAGFIVQLFVVPAVIVVAVVAIWILFGRIAAGEQDWKELVVDLGSSNPARQWRAAHGLAQMLRADEVADGDARELTNNKAVATALSELLTRRLQTRSAADEGLDPDELLKQQEFLARTLGFLDVNDVVLPILGQAMSEEHDRAVRKNAIASVALIAGRAAEAGSPFEFPDLLDQLIDVTADPDPLIRQVATYTLGLIPAEKSKQVLRDLLNDADRSTRWNAAIALARQGSLDGYDVLRHVLQEAVEHTPEPEHLPPKEVIERRQFRLYQQPVMIGNILSAIEANRDELSKEQITGLTDLVRSISESYHNDEIRIKSRLLLSKLSGTQ